MHVFYLRISTETNRDGHGFDRQLATCSKCAGKGDYQVFKDIITGTSDHENRPAFSEMIEYCNAHSVKTIYVESLNRLARQMRVQEQTIYFLMTKGLTLVSAETGEDITEAYRSDPTRRAMAQMMGVFAEWDKSQLVAKLRKAREAKKLETGKCEGRKLYGETPEEQEVVKYARKLKRQRHSVQEIADMLNDEGKLTQSGKLWTRQGLDRVLKRPLRKIA
ncbi:Resolvase-like protein [Lentisphaera araneosa HTCC2155]|uniref:Resolvase-like protein n=1 Tax=Lentisphaera araneosa HTCC2155 TaxID=313628 RepID=A6DSB7_9BACT|nr:recombinase family protein [Lentisphaera araneosa]EDM25462.1 Resolvase-like protein [Lentisphaera araneosa HTCC2155]